MSILGFFQKIPKTLFPQIIAQKNYFLQKFANFFHLSHAKPYFCIYSGIFPPHLAKFTLIFAQIAAKFILAKSRPKSARLVSRGGFIFEISQPLP